MKKLLVLLALLCSCDPPEAITPGKGDGDWILVDYTPGMSDGQNGIYKKHSEKEHVTYYAAHVHGGWSVSAVKD
jgi:hypothetical protein